MRVLKGIVCQVVSGIRWRFQKCHFVNSLKCHKGPLKVILGAGGTSFPGWVSSDYPYINVVDQATFEKYFKKGAVDTFLAEHVFEHLSITDAKKAFRNCFEFLSKGGKLRIAVPDGYHRDEEYLEWVKPGGCGPGSDDHKVLYNFRDLQKLLTDAGFSVALLEWFDEEGKFNFRDWSPEDGMIVRSTRFDERNKEKPTAFTSLIVDANKV